MLPQLTTTVLRTISSASRAVPSWTASKQSTVSRRAFHAASVLRDDDDDFDASENADKKGKRRRRGGGAQQNLPLEERRQGRPYLDPRAPRRLDAIRQDPMNSAYGGLIDILEHSAYCDGQREEHPEGFFFDNTRPEYDSDCDGDPFAAAYLTEDEIEFPLEYQPTPYIPGRVMDAMWYLYTAKKWPIARIASKYALQTNRVSAILNLKATEGEMKATGRYDPRLDQQMDDLYAGRFGTSRDKTLPEAGGQTEVSRAEGRDGWDPTLDMGVKYALLQDEEDEDEEMPVKTAPDGGRYGGHELRLAHGLPKRPVPKKAERVHHAKYIFRDISSATRKTPEGRRANPYLTSDWNGEVRLSSNLESLYRSWEPRRWSLKAVKGTATTYPFKDEDTHKPANYRLRP